MNLLSIVDKYWQTELFIGYTFPSGDNLAKQEKIAENISKSLVNYLSIKDATGEEGGEMLE